jgi:VWFA-related protein
MTRFATVALRSIGAVLAVSLASVVSSVSPAAQQARFRSTVDIIAVDAQVIDKDGYPIAELGPEAFEVSINGHKRKVVSAQFLRHSRNATRADAMLPDSLAETPIGDGRTIVLAVDNGSFETGSAGEAMTALKHFVARLEPADRVGLFVFPTGIWIPPTTDRSSVGIRLDRTIGEKQTIRSHYNLSVSEIVDITAQSSNPNSFLTMRTAPVVDDATLAQMDPVRAVRSRECPGEADCMARIYAEGMTLAAQLEQQTEASLVGLEDLLARLTTLPGRKSVLLVSAGVLVSDRPDGRPLIGDVGRILGQTAARANAVVYTIHIDSHTPGYGSASKRGVGSSERGRERTMQASFLDEFSSAAGGSRLYVGVGGGDTAFDRVLREASAHYLLGVEPADQDRDGKARQLRVKVTRRGVTVRNRQWVLVPARER